MLGDGAKRHYTYRLKQAINSVLPQNALKSQRSFAKVVSSRPANSHRTQEGPHRREGTMYLPRKVHTEWSPVYGNRRRNLNSDFSENMNQAIRTSNLPLHNRFSVLGNF